MCLWLWYHRGTNPAKRWRYAGGTRATAAHGAPHPSSNEVKAHILSPFCIDLKSLALAAHLSILRGCWRALLPAAGGENSGMSVLGADMPRSKASTSASCRKSIDMGCA